LQKQASATPKQQGSEGRGCHKTQKVFNVLSEIRRRNSAKRRQKRASATLKQQGSEGRRCHKTSAKKAVRSWLKSVEKSSRSTANLLQKQEKSIESQLEPQLKAHLQAE
jgi:hypothetical protein